MTTNTVRVGVVGIGPQARETLLPVLHAIEEAAVVAVADLDEELAEKAARIFGVPNWYRDREEMMRHERLRLLVVSVPHTHHAVESTAALKDGVSVYVEKPMATSVQDAVRMVAAADRQGLTLAGGSQFPWQLSRLLDRVRASRNDDREYGPYGPYTTVEARFMVKDGIPERPGFWASPQHGGVVFDLDPHLGSVVVAMMGPSVAVKAEGSGERGRALHGPEFRAWDTVESTWRFPDGAQATLKTSWAAEATDIGFAAENLDARLEVRVPSPELDPLDFVPIVYRRLPSGRFDDGTELPECTPVPTEWAQFDHMRAVVRAVSAGTQFKDPGLSVGIQAGLNAAVDSLLHGGQKIETS